MKSREQNPLYDYGLVHPQHIDLLKEIAAGKTRVRNGVPHLLKRSLVRRDGFYDIALNPIATVVLHGIQSGAQIKVTEQYHLPVLHGLKGAVTGIFAFAGGVRIEARFARNVGAWCFYETTDDEMWGGRNRACSKGTIVPVSSEQRSFRTNVYVE